MKGKKEAVHVSSPRTAPLFEHPFPPFAAGNVSPRALSSPDATKGEVDGLAGLFGQDVASIRAPAEAVLAGTDGPQSDAALAAALATLGAVAWHEGRIADAIGLVRAGVGRADRGTQSDLRAYSRLLLAVMLISVGEFEAASNAIRESSATGGKSDEDRGLVSSSIERARLHLVMGQLDDAVAGLESAAAGTAGLEPQAHLICAAAALLRGDLRDAAQHTNGSRVDRRYTMVGSGTYTWIEARLADAQCGPVRAVELLEDVYDDLPQHRDLLIEVPSAAAWLVRTALSVGDRARAAKVSFYADLLASDNASYPSVVAAAEHARGVLGRDPAALARAADGYREPWARASAAEDAGVVHMENSDIDAATQAFAIAVREYEQAGATRDFGRVRTRVRALPSRHRRRGSRPQVGWTSLTDTERRVALKVAEGLTNPQVGACLFLSRHTIDFHLRQIFRKLSIHSRVELARVVVSR
jgi:DNA-binding CsgD family transcriptional regulator